MASTSTDAPEAKGAKKIGPARIVGIVVSAVLAVAMVAIIVAANTVLPKFNQIINSYFGVEQSWSNDGVDTSGLDLTYNKADYDMGSISEAEETLDKDIAGEGYVLLKNGDSSLPLEKGTKLSFVGGNSRSLGVRNQTMLESTLGIEVSSSDALTPAMEAAGLSVNTTLTDFYINGKGKDYVMGEGSVSYGDDEDFSINECPLSVMRDAGVLDSLEGTTPVFVMKRVAGEGRDMPRSMYNHATSDEDKAKSYLEPDSTELEILQYLNDNFDNTVLLINSNAAIELDWLEQFPNIKSVIVVPTTGTYGAEVLGSILAGDVNPSGHTVDTYVADASAAPAAQNFGDYQYLDESGNLTKYNYVSYEEGIYVGYRYYETRYEDVVLNQGNAGDFNYEAEVCYPFGYGLSYTTFEWSDFSTSWSGKTCTATVTVTNTGDVAGKDAVEIYAQSPYTDYDRANGVEKAAVQLVGYAKTKLLEPGESQVVTVTFDESQLASYDANGAKTYILDAGTYYVTAGTDAHAAVNNILAAKGAKVDGDKALADTYVPANAEVDTTTYSTDSLTGVAVTNQLDDAKGDVTYLTRSDWTGTFPTHDGTPTTQVSTWGNEINGEDGVSYTYGKVASAELLAQLDSTDSGNPDVKAWDGELVYGADNGLTLADLRGLDYDDPKWSDLLDQLTPDDYNLMVARAGYGTEYLESVGKPAGTDADSTSGWSWGGTGMTFCNPMTVGQTWNQEIAYRLGNMIGNESLLGGATGWYAPAMNIHRSPYSGRNGEYFSEDPFLSGAMASQEVKGAAEKGVYTMIKHFAFNDQENHRGDRGEWSMATWLNEQSARELYLKPFEMCMKVGDVELNYVKQNDDGTYENDTTTVRACQGLMTSFNRIGATWCGGSYNLLTGIVRTEWGFDGWIITDNADMGKFMGAEQMIEAGGDAKLTTNDQSDMWSFDSTDAVSYRYARESVHHLLYTMANSHSMNGAMHGSTFVSGGGTGMQKADIVRWALTGVGAVGLAIIVAANVVCEVRRRKRA
ncbi:glycoside hydrolase family 3 N-terminal domain-containing protein [Paratractidigestivibacter sp.]|uniref:glycoside hydrolase family 3 N-terminal domain-containing protein n=1 Tax=Paratractidigestivibacter sp. TaxID=2847316 RepID=UPI002AC9591F|nr:glycoside hydrolase family 3 N-terminal domain-containing protein [Paratractidigestivibacter sp.]